MFYTNIYNLFLIELLKSPVSSFGRPASKPLSNIKSFIDYKNGKGKPEKKNLTSKGKGKAKKDKDDSEEVIISVGLMYFDENDEKMKEKRGKKLPIKVKKDSNYKTLLESAQTKWKDYHRNLYEEGAEYTLLLEDGQEACFLPGSKKEFFCLEKYKEGILKDYKRITLYLCTVNDFKEQVNRTSDVSENEEGSPTKRPKICCSPSGLNPTTSTTTSSPSGPPQTTSTSTSVPSCSGMTASSTTSIDDKGSWFVLDELNRIFNQADSLQQPEQPQSSEPDSAASIVKLLEEQVVADGKISLYIVIRRGVSVSRAISLWNRATSKVNPIHVVRVKYIGEDGIDDGALAKEFFSTIIPSIGEKFFPDGSPLYSTNELYNYNTIGEILAASLSQGGPAPCFFSQCVYDTLVSGDVNLNSLDLEKQLTEKELTYLEEIKSNVLANQDTILEHGYTGPITDSHLDSITKAVVASILSRRALMLKELRKGMELFGLAQLITKYPKVCESLFVAGGQEAVDANYLFSLIKPEFSSKESSRRAIEEAVMDYFQDFIFNLEDQETTSGYKEPLAWKSHGISDDDEEVDDDVKFNEADLSPAAVMGWMTGQRHRGLARESLIYVRFDHDCLKRNPNHTVCFPYVGACGREITLPVSHMASAQAFKLAF